MTTGQTRAEDLEITTYLKYCSDNEAVINGIFSGRKIRFTQPWALNDPLEFNPSIRADSWQNFHADYEFNGKYFPSGELWYRIRIVESQINNFGILSLTKVPDSFDMWSRYANGHKGFLIEFKEDFTKHSCMRSKTGVEYPVERVIYVEDYSINLDKLANEYTDRIRPEELRKILFYRKTSRWAHEKEYRLVRPLTESLDYQPMQRNTSYRDNKIYLFDFSLDCISSITFGAYMSIECKKHIEASCEGYNISFRQAWITRNEKDEFGLPGKVRTVSIDKFGSRDRFYSMIPQAFCWDMTQAEPVRIDNLSELPYYEGNEEAIHSLYANSKSDR